jgi:hypothetical protein
MGESVRDSTAAAGDGLVGREASSRLEVLSKGYGLSVLDLGLLGAMGRRKYSALWMSRTKVSQQPRWSAIKEQLGPRRQWVQIEKRGAFSLGTW